MIINYILYNVNICVEGSEFMGIKYNNHPYCTCGMVLVVKEGFHKCILFWKNVTLLIKAFLYYQYTGKYYRQVSYN